MRTLRFILFGLPLVIGFSISCSDKSTQPQDQHTTTFPLKIGNRWVYQEKVIIIPFNIPSLADTVSILHGCGIVATDTIRDSLFSFIFDDTLHYDNGNPIQVFRDWYVIDDSCVRVYDNGYYSANTGDINGKDYWPPDIILKFPIFLGKSWNYYDGGTLIEKHVVDYMEMEVAGKHIRCDVVATTFSGDAGGRTEFTEWYSNEGLIYREWGPQRSMARDSTGDIIDSVDIYSISKLAEVSLIQ
jgi:hypothetical protein